VAAARARAAIPRVMTMRFMLLLFQGMIVLDNPTIERPGGKADATPV
jgi:hypothetical protein